MNIYANAFRLVTEGAVDADTFLDDLQARSIHQFEHAGRSRVLAIERGKHFYRGVLLSHRDQGTHLVIKTDGQGNPVARHKKITGGQAADFSFFIISKNTMNGIFTQYRGGGGLSAFGNILKKQFRAVVSQEINDAVSAANNNGLTTKEIRGIKKPIRDSKLTVAAIPTVPDFSKELKKLRQITKFEYLAPTVQTSWLRSLRQEVKYERHSITFDSKTPSKTLRVVNAIVGYVTSGGVDVGTAFGKNSRGINDRVSIDPETFCMDKYKYDDHATGTIELGNFEKQSIIKELFSVAKKHKLLF